MMKQSMVRRMVCGVAACCGVCLANNPPGSPGLGGEMSHVLVTVFEGEFFIGFESPDLYPVVLQNSGAEFEGGAGVLNGAWINGQYGWLVSGFWGPPSGGFVWMRLVEQTAGLECYLGRPMSGMAQYSGIFGTGGSVDRIRWDGTMLHNYYAADRLGPFEAEYEVYFGDATGVPIAGSATAGRVTLAFELGDGDVNNDGVVDVEDMYAWHAGEGSRDCDGNGSVGVLDVLLLRNTVRWEEVDDVTVR